MAKEKGKNNRIENDEREARKVSPLALMCFTRKNKEIPFTRLVVRRPSIVGGERGWQQKVRGDGLGKREIKTIFTMTYLPLFLFQAPCRHCQIPPRWFLSLENLARGLWRGCDLVTSIFDVTIGRNINLDKNSRLCSASKSALSVNNAQATAQQR